MTNNKPRISIGLPVYNGEQFIRKALDSILAQTFEDFEIIISDNHSTDRTQEICQSYLARDKRIRYYRNSENLGAAPNYNRVFELSTGEYFKWVAADDIWASDYLEQCIKVLDSDPSIVLCHSKTVLIDENGQKLTFDTKRDCFVNKYGQTFRKPEHPQNLDSFKAHERYREILFGIRWCFQIFGVIRADILKKSLLIEPYYGSDKVLLAELSLMGRFAEISEPFFFRRCHSGQSRALASKTGSWIAKQSTFPQLFGFGKFIFPRLLCLGGYKRVIFRTPLSWRERSLCLLTLIFWLCKQDNWGRFGSEVYRKLNRLIKPELEVQSMSYGQPTPQEFAVIQQTTLTSINKK